MGQGISEVLPFAVGIAISPVPIIAIILILFSDRARSNGLSFLAGWVIGLAAVSTVVYLVSDAANAGSDSTTSDSISWGKVVLGVLLLGLARREFAKRPAPGEPATLPKWMATVESITPVRAFGLVLSVVNPKNLALAVGAAAGLGQLGLDTEDAVVALAVFVAVGSLSILFAVVYEFAGGERATKTLDEMKAWLTEHNAAVMAVLFLVFGTVLIAKGIGLLSS
jgi:hypothetical protein